jgi:uncharacterized protein YdhG (YjbR/CyaY superfamily)
MTKPTSVEEYFDGVPDQQRAVLEQLRSTIREAAPDATEAIAYDMPAFRQNGRFLVSYAAFRDHCSLFPASDAVMAELGDEVRPYFSGKGTLRFDSNDPIPASLVRRIVEVLVRENTARPRG